MKEKFLQVASRNLKRPIAESDFATSLDELGVDSLELMELIVDLEGALGTSVDTRDIPFDCTLGDIYQRLQKAPA